MMFFVMQCIFKAYWILRYIFSMRCYKLAMHNDLMLLIIFLVRNSALIKFYINIPQSSIYLSSKILHWGMLLQP